MPQKSTRFLQFLLYFFTFLHITLKKQEIAAAISYKMLFIRFFMLSASIPALS